MVGLLCATHCAAGASSGVLKVKKHGLRAQGSYSTFSVCIQGGATFSNRVDFHGSCGRWTPTEMSFNLSILVLILYIQETIWWRVFWFMLSIKSESFGECGCYVTHYKLINRYSEFYSPVSENCVHVRSPLRSEDILSDSWCINSLPQGINSGTWWVYQNHVTFWILLVPGS